MPEDLKLSMPASDNVQDNVRRRRKTEDDDDSGQNDDNKDKVVDKSNSRMAKVFKEVEEDGDEEFNCCQSFLYAISIFGMVILFPLVVWKMIAQVMVRCLILQKSIL